MGLIDRQRQFNADKRERKEAVADQAAAAVGACPDPQNHYTTKINKGDIDVHTGLKISLNAMYDDGYRLSHIYSHDGDTIQVFEHHFH